MLTTVMIDTKPRTSPSGIGSLNTVMLIGLIIIAILSFAAIECHIRAIEHPSIQVGQIVPLAPSSMVCFE